MSCNRKVQLLVSELFRGGRKEVTFASDPASRNATLHGSKTDVRIGALLKRKRLSSFFSLRGATL